ncbi:major facilitator superfamily domain-containing protein [Chlamydoabsidia padenii]|nr:major facilitator superfamily domain-containing protein [Chlamydoabsidia padenii]
MDSSVPAEKPNSMSSLSTNNNMEEKTTDSIRTISVNERTITTDRFDDLSNTEEQTCKKEVSHSDSGNQEKQQQQQSNDDFQDGGYGWLVVLGAFMVQVTSFGTATSWGVMQDYYHENRLGLPPPAETTTQMENQQLLNLSFVGTIALISTNICGPLAQILTSILGHRIVLLAGTFCVTLGLIFAGFATEIWHLYLTQGILFGIGASLMYCTIMGVAPLWFNKRRGLALGIVASGSGIGGLIIPFIQNAVNERLGSGWTYRILGLICFACDLIAVAFVKPRIPVPRQRKRISDIIQLGVLKDRNFLLFCVGSMVSLLGYFIPYFFLPTYATFIGLSASQGAALVATSSAMNFLGRIAAGVCADRIGKINTNILFTVIGGLSSLLIWPFAYSYGVLMAYAVIFGIFCGSYFALLSPITAQLLGFERFPTGLSIMLISNVVSVFGPNIASAIENSVNATPFFSYKIFSGVAYLVGAIFLFTLKIRLSRNLFAKV